MKSLISYADFEKVDMRVGEVVEATEVEGSDKLLCLKVDFGGEIGIKTVFSGIKKWYNSSSILNRKFIFIVNLEPKQFKFGLSEAMIVAAASNDEAVLYNFDKKVENGSIVL